MLFPDTHASAAPAVASPPLAHLPITADMLTDATMFAGLALLFAIIAILLRAERRRQLVGAGAFALVMLGSLWVLSHLEAKFADATLFDIAREAVLALLAFAVLRSVLIFLTRVVLARVHVPHILADVLLTLGLIVYALYRLSIIGVNLAGIVTTSAVITGAIAFSAQEILGALWAGLALQAEHTLREGDWIRYGEKLGQVVHLRWRSTAIATCDHETIIIPNAYLMKDKIILVGRHGEDPFNQRRHVAFQVAYENAPSLVTRVVDEALHRSEIHNVAREPAAFCVCKAFEDSGILYEVLYHIIDLHHYPETDSAVLAHVYAALKRSSMSIPFPHRVVQVQHDHEARAAQRAHDERLEVVRTTTLFSPLTEDERDHLAAELRSAPFAAGGVVFRQGEAADSLFVLASGTLGVFRETESGERRKLAELHAPAYFGEMGLLLGQPRGATVVAQTDAVCYRIDRRGFDGIVRKRPEVVEDLSRALAQRQAENDATLQTLDAEARARKTRGNAAELMRKIQHLFGLAPKTPGAEHQADAETLHRS